jgi:Domain of unknown function (DUF6458)
MGIGASIVLFAIGAILAYAVSWQLQGVNLHVIGIILMAVGAAGLLLSLLMGLVRPHRTHLDDRVP